MSTPTPRTDAAFAKWQEGWDRTPFGPDLARKLERELAAERARLDWLMAGGVVLVPNGSGYYVSRLHCSVSRAVIDGAMKEGK